MHSPPQRKRPGTAGQQPEAQDVCDVTTNLPLIVRWRNAVCYEGSPLTSTQRHVALTLSLYADATGRNCYPSGDALAAATGLSVRAVRDALKEIEGHGFACRRLMKRSGQAWKWTLWTLLLPEGEERRSLPRRKGEETDSPPLREGAEADDTKVRNLVPRRGEPRSTDVDRDVDRDVEGDRASATHPPEPVKKPRAKSAKVTFRQWLDALPEGEDAISAGDPIFDWAKRTGISREVLKLCWEWFIDQYTGPRAAKRYADWRQTFRNSVKGNWARLWYLDSEGDCRLSSTGLALQRDLGSRP